MAADAKEIAISKAEDAVKIAEVNAEKAKTLYGEIQRLQSLLDSEIESKSHELAFEADALKLELERAKKAEVKLAKMETLVKELEIELMDTKMAESNALGLANEWKRKAELFESHLEEAKQSAISAHDSLFSLTKQLEESKSMLDDTESEVISLRGKVEALELEVVWHKGSHEKSDIQLDLAKLQVLDLKKTVEFMKSKIRRVDEETAQSFDNEKSKHSNVNILAQENNLLTVELEMTKEDLEKAKQAMEGLASALHEVSSEVRDIKERLLIKQAEVHSATAETDELKLALENAQEIYEGMLDEAKNEIGCLKEIIDKFTAEAKSSEAGWGEKENKLKSDIKMANDEIALIKLERDQAFKTLERKNYEVKAAEEEANKLHDMLRRAGSKLSVASDAIEDAKTESSRLNGRLLDDDEEELQSTTQGNNDLHASDAASSEKISMLSKSLTELSSKVEGNGHLKENYDDAQKNGEHFGVDRDHDDILQETEAGISAAISEEGLEEFKEGMNQEQNHSKNVCEGIHVKMKSEIWDAETADKQLPTEMGHSAESTGHDLDARIDDDEHNQVNIECEQNGSSSKQQQQQQQQLQKKKKALLHKFGSLLKKKSSAK